MLIQNLTIGKKYYRIFHSNIKDQKTRKYLKTFSTILVVEIDLQANCVYASINRGPVEQIHATKVVRWKTEKPLEQIATSIPI